MAPAAASATATSPWGTAGGKSSLVETSMASLGGPCTSTESPGEVERCDSFQYVAVSLVEEGGGIDRMTRVYAVLTVDDERLCGSGYGGGERRSGEPPPALGRSVAAARCGR